MSEHSPTPDIEVVPEIRSTEHALAILEAAIERIPVDETMPSIDDPGQQMSLRSALLAVRDRESIRRLDPCTGAFARDHLASYQEVLKPGIGVVAVDVAGLKQVNDSHPRAHAAGDFILEIAVKSLQEVFEGDPVVRTGGDEFLVFSDMTQFAVTPEEWDEVNALYADTLLSSDLGEDIEPDSTYLRGGLQKPVIGAELSQYPALVVPLDRPYEPDEFVPTYLDPMVERADQAEQKIKGVLKCIGLSGELGYKTYTPLRFGDLNSIHHWCAENKLELEQSGADYRLHAIDELAGRVVRLETIASYTAHGRS